MHVVCVYVYCVHVYVSVGGGLCVVPENLHDI